MKKTVVFEFPDDFQFPEHFEEIKPARCRSCPLHCNDEEGNELEGIEIFLKKKTPVNEEIIEYEIKEGDTSDYWLPTAANALRPLYQLIALAKMRPDCIWDGNY